MGTCRRIETQVCDGSAQELEILKPIYGGITLKGGYGENNIGEGSPLFWLDFTI